MDIDEQSSSGRGPGKENTQDERIDQSYSNLGRRFKLFLQEFFRFLGELMSIRHETDYDKTREGIERDVPFRGHTVYILICSIFIASIGLNLNSPAVIIGAMLIAPLMGPILGIGLALGTNDDALLQKGLKNFGVMVAISLATSTIYFLLTPLVEYQPEILARTKPTTLDIFVAIFGGVAGIIAGSRKEKSNVIPGVAIATALMPPLCTSGFGLATGNMEFFLGAFYLFLLNSIFICASTVIGVRYLRFPYRKYVNPIKERKVKRFMAVFMIILILPSLWIFYGVLQESWFKGHAEKFVSQVIRHEGSRVVSKNLVFNDSIPVIEVFLYGEDVNPDTIEYWRKKMPAFGLEACRLEIYGSGDRRDVEDMDILTGKLQATLKADLLDDIYGKNLELIANKDERIQVLESEIFRLSKQNIRMEMIAKELQIQFSDLEKVSFANALESDFSDRVDTIPTFMVKWKKSASSNTRIKGENTIRDLMAVRLELDTVRVIAYN